MKTPALLFVFHLLFISTAFGETIDCTPIDDLPFVISAPGKYCLLRDLSYPATAPYIPITIDSSAWGSTARSNIILDFNGYSIARHGVVGPSNPAIKIAGSAKVIIRNGMLLDPWAGIVTSAEAQGFELLDFGIHAPSEFGMQLRSSNALIDNCSFILAYADVMIDNPTARGIVIRNSRFYIDFYFWGIVASNADNVLVENNKFISAGHNDALAIRDDTPSGTRIKYRHNEIFGFVTNPYFRGVSIGRDY